MAPKNTTTSSKDKRGGFAVGDTVVVTSKGSSYHGQRGVVSDFCKNGSHKQIYVDLERDGNKRLNVGSIKLVESGTKDTTENSAPIDHVSIKSEESSGTKEHSESTSSSFGKRVLFLYEYVKEIRESYNKDKDLSHKLKEVEKLILGLNLSK